jgi:hypothetical protein
MTWVLTNSGKRVDLLEPRPEQIDINDISHSLAHLVRFTGHGNLPLTVAEHSVRVSQLLENQGAPTYIQLWGLLHDAHEAYIGDISTPMKEALDSLGGKHTLGEFGSWFDEAVVTALGLEEIHEAHSGQFAQVHSADKMTGEFERGVILPDMSEWPIQEWVKKALGQRGKAPAAVMSPAQAKASFVTRYAQLRAKAFREFELKKLEDKRIADEEAKAAKAAKSKKKVKA